MPPSQEAVPLLSQPLGWPSSQNNAPCLLCATLSLTPTLTGSKQNEETDSDHNMPLLTTLQLQLLPTSPASSPTRLQTLRPSSYSLEYTKLSPVLGTLYFCSLSLDPSNTWPHNLPMPKYFYSFTSQLKFPLQADFPDHTK